MYNGYNSAGYAPCKRHPGPFSARRSPVNSKVGGYQLLSNQTPRNAKCLNLPPSSLHLHSPHIHMLQNAQASHHILRPKHPLTTLPPLLFLPLDLLLSLLPTHDQDLEGVDS
jgi:hypothetical protein